MNTEKELDVERAGEKKVVLKHCINGIEHLSFLHSSHMSPVDTIPLPFRGENEIEGNCCRGLFYFNSYDFDSDVEDREVRAVIVNLTTKELKLLPQPISPETYSSDSGLGYDPESDDYKVIRIRFGGLTAEVYSLRKDSWKVIAGPGDDDPMDGVCGVYIERLSSSYWKRRAYPYPYPKGINDYILSFDFSTETFSRVALPPSLNPPPSKLDTDIRFEIFDCDGFLGVVGYKDVCDFKPRDAKHIELWVDKGGSWETLFSAILLDVGLPIGVRDGRFLFLQGSSSCGHSHLMVYDWVKEELREHDVYVKPPRTLLLLSYVDNTIVLPDATPLISNRAAQNVQHSNKGSITHSLSSGMALKRCTRPQNKNKVLKK